MGMIRSFLAASVLAFASLAAFAQTTAVYHVNDADSQALDALRNMRNHLDVDPAAKLTLVAHSKGVRFLMNDAKAPNGTEYASLISALKSSGVNFEVCEITLKRGNLKKEQFIQEADFTPSGVVRLTQLQKQGAAYIKP